MSERFVGKVALITGAGSGIGRETARIVAAEGGSVFGLDIDADRVAETVTEIEAAGGSAAGEVCDISDPAACAAAVDSVLSRFGRLDVVCNIAGITMMKPVGQVADELWERMLAVNLSGPFYLSRAAVPALIETRGNVVNIASQAALQGYSHLSAYSASKGGVIALTRAMAVELAPQGIRVNCVCPGSVATNIADSIEWPDEIDPEVTAVMMQRNPPMSQPEEVAYGIAFVASDQASSMTGAVIPIDGGSTA